jgi:hypothetical protein
MACNHPASSLKADSATQANGKVTIRFCCISCLVPIVKEFLLHVPEPTQPASGIADLMSAEDGAAVAPQVKRGANSPWRNPYKVATP